ncbi:hypothetical protein [Streptomyces anandii]|uniref:hypothetical protein n=1 Tax=Streptomyces anandii TaxID=285454 RepID=UPI0037BA8E65
MTYTERAVTVTRREWAVPVDPAFGANHVAVSKAWSGANRAYREDHLLAPEAGLPDNAIAFWPGDTEIVISYETEQPARLVADDLARVLATYDHLNGRLPSPFTHLSIEDERKYREMARNTLDFVNASAPPQN